MFQQRQNRDGIGAADQLTDAVSSPRNTAASLENAAHARLKLQATALNAAANGIVITNEAGTIEWVNPAFASMTGYRAEEVVGKNPRLLKSGRHDESFYKDLWSTISSGTVWQGQITNRRKNGSLYIEEMTITPVGMDTGRITHFIAIKADVTARREAEAALARAEEKYRNIFEQAMIGIFQSTPEGKFLMMNPAMAKMLRCDSPESAIHKVQDIGVLYTDPVLRQVLREQLESKGALQNIEHEFCRKDGTELWLSLNLRCIYNKDGSPEYYEGTAEDITERKILERQLRHAQKMEAIGRLAGGVAHDFNNILSVITGYGELLKSRPDLDATAAHQISEIYEAGKRAAALTQQLLAFSRKQIAQLRILNLNEVVSKLSGMLRRVIGDDVELMIRLSCRDARVNVDPGQIDQVLMNLAINARDAMPNGGKLIIETSTCDLDRSYKLRHKPVIPGHYVRLTVTDTGCGMDQETMSHLFEPFFTTKEPGKGTGLGLSIVYGVVKQASGYIWAYSEPGHGTSFKIYLPLQQMEVEHSGELPPPQNLSGSENILLVEDDEALRSMVVGFLRQLGYFVLEACDGEHALELMSERPVEVLITDIIMPRMSGRDLADRVTSKFPDAKVLYISGYTHDGVVQTHVLGAGEMFLQKPFALAELTGKLREIISS